MTDTRAELASCSLQTFVPSRDYAVSEAFYRDLGFQVLWRSDDLMGFAHGDCRFLLQNFYAEELANNFMMFLVVEDLDAWWAQILASGVLDRYAGVRGKAPEPYPWGFREIHLIDPAGVLWHIAQRDEVAAA